MNNMPSGRDIHTSSPELSPKPTRIWDCTNLRGLSATRSSGRHKASVLCSVYKIRATLGTSIQNKKIWTALSCPFPNTLALHSHADYGVATAILCSIAPIVWQPDAAMLGRGELQD